MRALIVSYHFPPDAEIGGIRPYELVRHLPEFGIEPWVLTVRPEFAEAPDLCFDSEGVPSARILRTAVERTFRDAILGLWRRTSSASASPSSPATTGREESDRGPAQPWVIHSDLRARVLSWLAFPDLRIGWYRPAVAEAERLFQLTPFDLVLSTSPPNVAHLIGAHLAARHRLPWVMDFRDPWFTEEFSRPRSALMRFLHLRLLRRTARHASACVANTPALRGDLERRLGALGMHTLCIPNGLHPVVPTPEFPERPPAFEIGYVGNIVGRRSAAPFLRGLRAWLDGTTLPQPVRVRFVGSGFGADEQVVRELGLGEFVTFGPRVPRAEAQVLMMRHFVLLLLANEQPLQVPGKVYEYLATGRRILAFTEREGATAQLLRGLPGCELAETEVEVAEALQRLFGEYQRGAAGRIDRRTFFEQASYLRRAEAFAGLFRSVARSAAQPGAGQ